MSYERRRISCPVTSCSYCGGTGKIKPDLIARVAGAKHHRCTVCGGKGKVAVE
jgi:hypothetical protein